MLVGVVCALAPMRYCFSQHCRRTARWQGRWGCAVEASSSLLKHGGKVDEGRQVSSSCLSSRLGRLAGEDNPCLGKRTCGSRDRMHGLKGRSLHTYASRRMTEPSLCLFEEVFRSRREPCDVEGWSLSKSLDNGNAFDRQW